MSALTAAIGIIADRFAICKQQFNIELMRSKKREFVDVLTKIKRYIRQFPFFRGIHKCVCVFCVCRIAYMVPELIVFLNDQLFMTFIVPSIRMHELIIE